MKLLSPGDKLYRIHVSAIDGYDDDGDSVSVSVDTYKVISDGGGFGGICIQQVIGAPSSLLIINHNDIGPESYRYTCGGYSTTVEGAIELYRLRCESDVADMKKKIAEKERLFGVLFQVADKVIGGEHFHDIPDSVK